MAAGSNLVGRDDELALARKFVHGDSAHTVLAIEGEAGIGKTALWLEAIASAQTAGADVRRSRPAESETAFAFSALADVLGGRDENLLARLPEPQRRALEAALLLREDESEPPPRAVAAALLSTLRVLAEERPVLVAIDDAQWIDTASREALAYALRRIGADERVRFLIARRPASDGGEQLEAAAHPDDLARIELGPLSLGALQALLRSRVDAPLARVALRRIHEASGGNPFFALELASALARSRRHVDATNELPVPRSLSELLAARLGALSPESERAALVVALASEPSVAQVAGIVGSAGPIDEAVTAGVLTREGESLRLVHPLLRPVIQGRARADDRRTVHAELARSAANREEAVRHTALATQPPDEAVAAALAAEADRAVSRGALFAAIELAESAVEFTDPADEERVAHRLVVLAERQIHLGDFSEGIPHLERALASLPSGPWRARALTQLAESAVHKGDQFELYDLVLAVPGIDAAGRARGLAMKASDMALNIRNIPEAAEWAREAIELAREANDVQLVTYCGSTIAWTEALSGRDIGAFLDTTPAPGPWDALYDHPDRSLGVQAMWRGDLATARRLFERLLAESRERDEEWSIFVFMLHLFEMDMRVGNAAQLEHSLAELVAVTTGVESTAPALERARAHAATLRGDVELVRQLTAATVASGAEGRRWSLFESHRALGVAELFAGNAAAAVEQLELVAAGLREGGLRDPGAIPVLPDLVDALALEGRLDEAAQALAELEASATANHPWAQAMTARSRGHLLAAQGERAAAVEAFEDAAARFRSLSLPLDEARTLLALGSLRRRSREQREARALLEQAAAMLDELGVVPLAERARDELARVGGRRGGEGLTPTEERVAQLVALGRTNRQVAAELVVSASTVEAHLTRIYAKLGLHSRVELARRLSG